LRAAAHNGDVQRQAYGRQDLYPLRWSVLPGNEQPAEDEQELKLEAVSTFLERLHAATGWDYGITMTASAHVQWNVELRVTPEPHAHGTSDRSITVLRVGPPEWALSQAYTDIMAWLAEINPPHMPGPCVLCDDDTDGYHGNEKTGGRP
jgi:hypothetical protein